MLTSGAVLQNRYQVIHLIAKDANNKVRWAPTYGISIISRLASCPFKSKVEHSTDKESIWLVNQSRVRNVTTTIQPTIDSAEYVEPRYLYHQIFRFTEQSINHRLRPLPSVIQVVNRVVGLVVWAAAW